MFEKIKDWILFFIHKYLWLEREVKCTHIMKLKSGRVDLKGPDLISVVGTFKKNEIKLFALSRNPNIRVVTLAYRDPENGEVRKFLKDHNLYALFSTRMSMPVKEVDVLIGYIKTESRFG